MQETKQLLKNLVPNLVLDKRKWMELDLEMVEEKVWDKDIHNKNLFM